MKPSEKSPAMEQICENMSQSLFGRSRKDCIELNICVSCGQPAKDFRDNVSAREYPISGLCQNCQDEIFGKE